MAYSYIFSTFNHNIQNVYRSFLYIEVKLEKGRIRRKLEKGRIRRKLEKGRIRRRDPNRPLKQKRVIIRDYNKQL